MEVSFFNYRSRTAGAATIRNNREIHLKIIGNELYVSSKYAVSGLKSTLITGGVGGAEAGPHTCKLGTFFKSP